jgi:hypothetical protein
MFSARISCQNSSVIYMQTFAYLHDSSPGLVESSGFSWAIRLIRGMSCAVVQMQRPIAVQSSKHKAKLKRQTGAGKAPAEIEFL